MSTCSRRSHRVAFLSPVTFVALSTCNLLVLEKEVKTHHGPAEGEFCRQVTVLELRLLVLIAEDDAVLLTFADRIGKQSLHKLDPSESPKLISPLEHRPYHLCIGTLAGVVQW